MEKEAEFGRLTGLVDETRAANELENTMSRNEISSRNNEEKKIEMR